MLVKGNAGAGRNGGKAVGWFLAGLFGAVGMAWVAPEWGRSGGALAAEFWTKVGVALIFMVQGLMLPQEALGRGLRNWRLQGFGLVGIFLGFPLLALPVIWVAGPWLTAELQIGLVYLAFLPTTISTAVVFTGQAGGDVAGALFTVALANLVGVFVSPAVLAAALAMEAGADIPFLPLLAQIFGLIGVPFALGQVLRVWLRNWANRHQAVLARGINGVILLIVYAALCDLFSAQAAGEMTGAPVVSALVLCGVLLVLSRVVVGLVLRWAAWPVELKLAGFFCVTEKTLAAGVPMATLVFAGAGPAVPAAPAVVLLPILIYHPLQLAVDSVLAQRWVRVWLSGTAGGANGQS